MHLDDYDIDKLRYLVVQYLDNNASLARDEDQHNKLLIKGGFSNEEHHIALAAVKEKILQEIAFNLSQSYVSNESNEDASLTHLGVFKNVYRAFVQNQKYELLPLFYNHDLTKKSYLFFSNSDIRDYFFETYKKFLQKDSLSIDDIFLQYSKDTNARYFKLFPVYEKIMFLSSKLS
tara:strand:+ start:194 stop:721 length:528 start_codon:yes stop_codon:yes gene_type:complete